MGANVYHAKAPNVPHATVTVSACRNTGSSSASVCLLRCYLGVYYRLVDFVNTMHFNVITPFPEAFASYLGVSILKRAIAKRLIAVRFFDPRGFVKDKHRTIDGKPYGGGAGMVLMAEPILRAVEAAQKKIKKQKSKRKKTKIVVLSAKGKQFSQKMAYDWAKKYGRIILISGRYEGIDERVRQILKAEEVSIGPYVLTDGDAAAMVVVSAVSRLVPGVIRLESLGEESHWDRLLKQEARSTGSTSSPQTSSGQATKTAPLEYPHYTRPEVLHWKGKRYRVPKILLSGNHGEIGKWRQSHQH